MIKKLMMILPLLLLLGLGGGCSEASGEEGRRGQDTEMASSKSIGHAGQTEFTTLQDAVYYIVGVFISLFIVFGVKKISENTVNSYLILMSLKRQGKIAVGLKIKYQDWEGVVTDIKSNNIKIDLSQSPNFVYINPKLIHDGAVEIVVREDG